ncbi:MAG TPA: hypothetical protein VF755_01215, partial [Catenuloplanes sp.]
MSINRRARLGLFAAAAVAATAIAPAAAHAEPAKYTLSVHDGGVSEAGKWFSLSLRPAAAGPFRLDNSQLVIDTADVADFATAWVPSFNENGPPTPAKNCTTAGTRITCDNGSMWYGGPTLPYLVVQAKPGAEIGRSGKLTITVTADGIAPLVATPKITVADDVDLAVRIGKTPVTGERGKPVAVPIEVSNTGSKPVKGAALRVVAYQGMQVAGKYTNCGYDRGDQQVHCRFDAELAPGATYVLSDPTLAVRANAPANKDGGYLAQLWTGDDADEVGLLSGLTRGTSGVLRLVRKPDTGDTRALTTDSNGANNLAFGWVKVPVTPSAPATPTPSASASSGVTPPASRGTGSAGGG